jgi:hypothetical protein
MSRTMIRGILLGFLVGAVLAGLSNSAFAQCAMCKEALANSANGADIAKTFDHAVLMLLAPPVVLFCTIFGLALRSGNRTSREPE